MIYFACMVLLAMIAAPIVILVCIIYRKVVEQREWDDFKRRNKW